MTPPALVAGVADPGSGSTSTATKSRSKLWLFVLAAFALQFAAWTAWFVVAAKHKVAEVPLVRTDKQ